MKIKVCGITREKDCRLAEKLGAWAVGFIFAPASPRSVSLAEAEKLASFSSEIERVAVFQEPSFREVESVARGGFVSILQIYSKNIALLRQVKDTFSLPLVQGVSSFSESTFPEADYFLYDIPGADWSKLPEGKRQIVAGKINTDNVGQILRVCEPFAVDLSSGLENSPGKKDKVLMEEFFGEVHN